MLCEYKNLLGEPNKGIHAYRIANIAVVDLALTVLAAGVISRSMNLSSKGFIFALIILLILGIITHFIFCVDTAVNKFIVECLAK